MSMNRRGEQKGQAVVVLALSVTAILVATAMVIDGGNAMAQQRGTQNATDSAALAGAVVIAEKLSGDSRTDSDVVNAMERVFDDNNPPVDDRLTSTMLTSYYIDFHGNVVGTVGRGGGIPGEADGVRASGQRMFKTWIAAIGGQPSWTAGAQATALAGALRSVCTAGEICGIMPVTFSIPITTCDGSSRSLRLGVDWPLVSLDVALTDSSGTYESIVPLCKNGPGGVGWLDFECGGNLRDQILDPCVEPFDLPTWLHTSAGNSNNVEGAVNSYADSVIIVPMFDSTCRDVPSTGLPAHCPPGDTGSGDNLWYHIPRVAHFLLDQAYIQGNNHPECNSSPGEPLVGGNGGTSCFKGWFVRYIDQGRVDEWIDCDEDEDEECMVEPVLGVQLVQ